MRFLILNSDYPRFLCWLYTEHPGLENQPYEEQMQTRVESLFGVADFYSTNLEELGHEACDIHTNNEFMQRAWAREHGGYIKEPKVVEQQVRSVLSRLRRVAARTALRRLKPFLQFMLGSTVIHPSWFYEILKQQIKQYKPDVLLNQAMNGISTRFLREMTPYVKLLVGQTASPFSRGEDFGCYDVVISSLPNFVDYFRKMGVPSELNRLAFDSRVLKKISNEDGATIPVSFVGSLSRAHATRERWLKYLCQQLLDLHVWGKGIEDLPRHSPICHCYRGEVWGIEMYQILRNSKITLNHHIDVADLYANNCRLYETTGVGTLLITDWKENLHEIFEPGEEVVAYRSPEECAELVQYYLEHDNERETIARAGQERTLQEHTYYQRIQELTNIVYKYL